MPGSQGKRRLESHITPGSVRKCEGVWGSEPSHCQGNSHFGRWTFDGLPKLQRAIAGAKPQFLVAFFISLEKLLKRRYLKWSCIAHLDIWNTSYGQKKGRESNSQESASFDSRPLKVGNRPEILGCKERATYRWKVLDESYNFAWNCIAIQGLFTKLWGSKVPGIPCGAISGLPFGSPEKNSHLDVGSVENHRVYYKGEGGRFPEVQAVVSLVCPCCPCLVPAPSVLQLCTNHLVWIVCRPVWVSEACQLFLVPSRSSNTPLYPSKCCELRSVLQLFLLPLFSYLGSHLSPLGSWECVKRRRLWWRHHLSFSGEKWHIKCTTSSCKWNKGIKTSKRLYHEKFV
jgi:hypothetical protein